MTAVGGFFIIADAFVMMKAQMSVVYKDIPNKKIVNNFLKLWGQESADGPGINIGKKKAF